MSACVAVPVIVLQLAVFMFMLVSLTLSLASEVLKALIMNSVSKSLTIIMNLVSCSRAAAVNVIPQRSFYSRRCV